jgi:hypothetical protein
MGHKDGGRWVVLTLDRAQWWGLVSAMLNIRLLESFDISLRVSIEFCCGTWKGGCLKTNMPIAFRHTGSDP